MQSHVVLPVLRSVEVMKDLDIGILDPIYGNMAVASSFSNREELIFLSARHSLASRITGFEFIRFILQKFDVLICMARIVILRVPQPNLREICSSIWRLSNS